MINHVVWLETVQPIAYGINLGPAAIFLAATMWACDGIFRPYVSVRMDAGRCWDAHGMNGMQVRTVACA